MRHPTSSVFLATLLLTLLLIPAQSAAQSGGATIIRKATVAATVTQGNLNLRDGRTVSDIVIRHIGVGEENVGVSVVQRTAVSPGETERGIAHGGLDEMYYVLSGEGTMVTGGEFVDPNETDSALLGPMTSGTLRGGVLQPMEAGDIAIIPKGMPHGWHEITTDTISYLVFRGDPQKVMEVK